ncbi:NADH-quinone oxidoreductase subunit J [Alphaproteobacteria bacterium]|nr:NADH-quinone oxidoreductase subunit J [Alphaproteobacteria bacterium]
MMVSDCLFWLVSCGIVGVSFLFLYLKNPVHILLCFLTIIVQISSLMMLLEAFFIALFFLIFYAALCIALLIFYMMTQNHKEKEIQSFSRGYQRLSLFVSAGLGGQLFFVLVYKAKNVFSKPSHSLSSSIQSPKVLGELIYTDYTFSFIILGVLFFVALLGIVLVMGPKKKKVSKEGSLERVQRDVALIELKDVRLQEKEQE